jgi:hypothetical protein
MAIKKKQPKCLLTEEWVKKKKKKKKGGTFKQWNIACYKPGHHEFSRTMDGTKKYPE